MPDAYPAAVSKEATAMTENNLRINPNLADRETLLKLPGIGEAVAERIIAGRPYLDVQDLLQVQGIGPKSLDRMRASLDLEPSDGLDGSSPAVKPERQTPAAVKPASGAGKGEFISRERALWMVLLGAVSSVVVAVILSLAILAGINGTLNVERQAAVRQLRVQTELMAGQIDAIDADLESLNSRLQIVESLSGRVRLLEDDAQALRTEVEAAVDDVGAVQASVASLSGQVESMQESVSTFDQFLQGIREVLERILPASNGEVMP